MYLGQKLINIFVHDLKNQNINNQNLELVLSDYTHWILTNNKEQFEKIISLEDDLNDFKMFLTLLFDVNELSKDIVQEEDLEDFSGECEKIDEFIKEIFAQKSHLKLRFMAAFCAFKLIRLKSKYNF